MSVEVSLQVQPEDPERWAEREELAEYLSRHGWTEAERDTFGRVEDVGGLTVELTCRESAPAQVASVGVAGSADMWDPAVHVALELAELLGWAVTDDVSGADVPRWARDAPVGPRSAFETWRRGLRVESRLWLVRRFGAHLVPRDVIWVSFLALVGALASKMSNALAKSVAPIWGSPGCLIAVALIVSLLCGNAALSVLAEVSTRELTRRYGSK